MIRQPGLFDHRVVSDAVSIKQAAIDQVMDNPATPEAWKEEALCLARGRLKEVHFIIALDLRAHCEQAGLGPPHHNRVWGGLMQQLYKEGLIKPTNQLVPVDDGPSHCAPRRMWESLIYGGK